MPGKMGASSEGWAKSWIVTASLSFGRHWRNWPNKIQFPSYEIVFFGRVSTGKSSLLNAIIGVNLRPVGITPITAAPTRIKDGLAPQLLVWKAESGFETYSVDHLAEFVTETVEVWVRRALEGLVHQVEVHADVFRAQIQRLTADAVTPAVSQERVREDLAFLKYKLGYKEEQGLIRKLRLPDGPLQNSKRAWSAIMRGELSPPKPTPSKPVGGEVVYVSAPKPVWVAGLPGTPAITSDGNPKFG
jgi:Dynamin family